MKYSNYLIITSKTTDANAVVVSHQLMLKAGYIRQLASGLYTWLPLGLKVLKKVEQIVREEMNKSGAVEILMPMVQPSELWEETGRWEKMDKELLRFKDRHDRSFCLGPTHEEIVTDLFRKNIFSYKSLPLNMYQIQTKFRDEVRPRFGLMRGREFLMKDSYSFDISKDAAMITYNKMSNTYCRIFERLGLDYRRVDADTGAIGGNYSHEFHVLADSGEDDLIFDKNGEYAVNVEKHDPETCPVSKDQLDYKKGIEVGHIFLLEDTYSSKMKATVKDETGADVVVTMGCYGIGVSRIVAAAIEQNNDEKGIIWPESMAPFKAVLINMSPKDDASVNAAESLYIDLLSKDIDIILDDRDLSGGQKIADADLMGFPWKCIIGKNSVANNQCDWENRKTGEKLTLNIGEIPFN